MFVQFLSLPFRSLPVRFPCISLQFSAPCFASPACITSSASSGMMLAMLGVLSSIRHPIKILVFGLVFGRCGDMLQKSLEQSVNPSPLIRAGPAQNVCSWSAHGRRHGAHGLIPEGKPCGLGLRPDHVRWPDLHADATQPATGHLALPVLSLPFPASPISRCPDFKILKTLRF